MQLTTSRPQDSDYSHTHGKARTGGQPASPERRTPANLLAAISWALLVTVMAGGYSLLHLLSGGGNLTPFEEQFFRAGHGHAGVLAAVGILYSGYLARTHLSYRAQVIAWCVYLGGVLTMSGGFFVHMLIGREGEVSFGIVMIVAGALVLAASVLYLAWKLFENREGVSA